MVNWAKQVLFGCLLGLFIVIAVPTYADAPPPVGDDPSGGYGGDNGDHLGGGANIQGGLLILIVLGLGYGAKKLYDAKVKVAEPLENEN